MLADRYRIERELGQGGMDPAYARVKTSLQKNLGRLVLEAIGLHAR